MLFSGWNFERFGLELTVLLKQNFDFALGFLELLAAAVGELNSLFEQFQSLFQSDVSTLQFIDDFFEPLQAIFELGQSESLLRF
jgi:hypothetical protein